MRRSLVGPSTLLHTHSSHLPPHRIVHGIQPIHASAGLAGSPLDEVDAWNRRLEFIGTQSYQARERALEETDLHVAVALDAHGAQAARRRERAAGKRERAMMGLGLPVSDGASPGPSNTMIDLTGE